MVEWEPCAVRIQCVAIAGWLSCRVGGVGVGCPGGAGIGPGAVWRVVGSVGEASGEGSNDAAGCGTVGVDEVLQARR